MAYSDATMFTAGIFGICSTLLRAGLSEQFTKEHFVEFGQGVASMSPALQDLEQLLLKAISPTAGTRF